MRSHVSLRPVLALGIFVVGIDAVIVSGLLPEIKSAFDLSSGAAGQLITAFGLGYAVLAPALARAASTRSRHAVLAGGLLVFAVANGLAALAPSYWLLLAARVLASCGAALYTPAALALASEQSRPGRRGQSMAVVLSGATAAAVVGVPAGLFVGAAAGWRATFAVIAAGSACVACVLAMVVAPSQVQHAAAPSIRMILADRHIQRIAAVTLLAYLGEFTLYSYLGLALASQARVSTHLMPVYYLLFGAAGVAGNIAGGRGSDRWAARYLAGSALGLMAIALITFPLLLFSQGLVAVPLACCGFAAWMLSIPQQRRLLTRRPYAASTVLGLNQSALYLGLSLSGITGALLLRVVSIGGLGYAAAGIVLIALAVSLSGDSAAPGAPAGQPNQES
jgi:MFS transporter, DHA1 family, inner membrane transport protein